MTSTMSQGSRSSALIRPTRNWKPVTVKKIRQEYPIPGDEKYFISATAQSRSIKYEKT